MRTLFTPATALVTLRMADAVRPCRPAGRLWGRTVTAPDDPTREQPPVEPTVTTAPAPGRPHGWWSAIPRHLGRARTSTVVIGLLFLAIGALYLTVKPEPVASTPAGGDSGVTEPTTTTGSTPTTPPPTTTQPAPTTTADPTTTEESTTTEVPTESGVPGETTETAPTPTPTETTPAPPVPTTPTPTG